MPPSRSMPPPQSMPAPRRAPPPPAVGWTVSEMLSRLGVQKSNSQRISLGLLVGRAFVRETGADPLRRGVHGTG
eukprot:1529985-Rhodomonas_salina.1